MRLVLVLWVVAAAACGQRASSPSKVTPSAGGVVGSNILRADYAGSRACTECHQELYDKWAASPMRNMTRDAATATIRAPFDGAVLRVGSETATMEMDGGRRIMRVDDKTGRHRFKITKVIGGRYREDFVGVELTGGDGREHVLPATYVFATKSWRYKGYSVMVKERPRMSWRAVWSQDCVPCHNTMPYVTMLYDELYGPGLPGYQGKLSDRVLPPSRTWKATPLDEAGFAKELEREIDFFGGELPNEAADRNVRGLLPAAADAMRTKLAGDHLVELGVGCEACHNGARAHAADSNILPSFEPKSALVGITPPRGQTGTRAQRINRACAKCHTVLFTHYEWTWEGAGRKDQHPGGSTTNSGEGRDFQLGGCSTQLACTACHDPHVEDDPAKLDDISNKICVTCHKQFATEKAIEIHTRHPLGSSGTACIACHMAKKNTGLDYSLVRYHRIGSPTETRRVVGDRPLECALCHADKSVEELVTTMEHWWGKQYDRAKLRALYGDDLGVNAIRATLDRGKPHEQATAVGVLGEARDKSAVAALVPMLSHEYPLIRYYAQRSLQLITGDPVAIDVGAPAADVARAAQAWLTARP